MYWFKYNIYIIVTVPSKFVNIFSRTSYIIEYCKPYVGLVSVQVLNYDLCLKLCIILEKQL